MLTADLKRLVGLAGFNEKMLSSHSIRRGGASAAFSAQVPGELIKLIGDWKSEAYLRYLDICMQHKINVAELMRDYLLKLAAA